MITKQTNSISIRDKENRENLFHDTDGEKKKIVCEFKTQTHDLKNEIRTIYPFVVIAISQIQTVLWL